MNNNQPMTGGRRRKHAAARTRIFAGGLAVSATLGLAGMMAATQRSGAAASGTSSTPTSSAQTSRESDDSNERSSSFAAPSVTAPATSNADTTTNAS